MAEAVAIAHAERERIIAEAQATARDIVAEAERAAQDIVARAVKIKAEADRALDEAKSKAACIQKQAQAALELAENIAKGRRLIEALTGQTAKALSFTYPSLYARASCGECPGPYRTKVGPIIAKHGNNARAGQEISHSYRDSATVYQKPPC